MEEIAKLIANYSILIVIAMLYLWDSIQNKKRNAEIEEQNSRILEQNTRCLEEMKNTNINIYKSLEIIQSDLKDVKEKVGERR